MPSRIRKHLAILGLAGAVVAALAAPSLAAERQSGTTHKTIHHRAMHGKAMHSRAMHSRMTRQDGQTMRQGGGYGEPYAFEGDVNSTGYNGMRRGDSCWVETDLGKGFGYWGSCATQNRALGAETGTFRTRNLPNAPR